MLFASETSGISQPEQIVQDGYTFLKVHDDDTNFEVQEAQQLVDSLTDIGKNSRFAKPFRSKSYFLIAKISWRIADKVKMKGGAEHGRIAVESIKESLDLDPNNKDAALSYAKTISDMTTQNFAIRKLLTSKLSINLEREAQDAIEHLDRLHLSDSASYPILKKYLD